MKRKSIPDHDAHLPRRGRLPYDTGITVQCFHNAMSLSQQIAIARFGGHAIQTRQLSDVNYDEDDTDTVDPCMEQYDSFERAEAIANSISERMSGKNKDKLNEVRV